MRRTDVEVPLRIQVGLICQAALHDIQAVVLTGFDCGHALTKRAVHHLGQCSDTRWRAADLQGHEHNNNHQQLNPHPPFLLLANATNYLKSALL